MGIRFLQSPVHLASGDVRKDAQTRPEHHIVEDDAEGGPPEPEILLEVAEPEATGGSPEAEVEQGAELEHVHRLQVAPVSDRAVNEPLRSVTVSGEGPY